MTTKSQARACERAYAEGKRIRAAGFGFKPCGEYDYDAWNHMFNVHFIPHPAVDRDEVKQSWEDGWHDEDSRMMKWREGYYECGRPRGYDHE